MRRGSAIARRWARALFGLAEDLPAKTKLLEEFRALTDLVVEESPELRRVLLTPIHPRRERRVVIGELCEKLELSEETRAFAMLLVDGNRTIHLEAIRDALQQLVDEASGRQTAEVTSARPLDPAELELLRQALVRRVNTEVMLDTSVDPGLIGGIVTRIGDLLLDGSVRTQLESLGDNLRRG